MLSLLEKVITNNQSTAQKRFRFKDNRGMATDNVTYVCVENLPFKNIDCMIDSDAFSKAIQGLKEPKIEQKDGKLIITEDLDMSEIGTEPLTTLLDIDKVPQGEEVEPGNLLEAIAAIKMFSSASQPFYATDGGYLLSGNERSVVRTPLTTKFKSPLVFIVPEIVALLLESKSPLTKILETEETMTFVFDFGWIETGKPKWRMPANLSSYFVDQDFPNAKLKTLEADFIKSLKRLCTLANKDEIIDFNSNGVQLIQGASKRHNVKTPMADRRIPPSSLSTILGLSRGQYDFESKPENVAFKTEKIDGYIACMPRPKN